MVEKKVRHLHRICTGTLNNLYCIQCGGGTVHAQVYSMISTVYSVGGQEKEWIGCFLNDLRAFGINADQWTTAAQDEGEWRRMA